MIPSGTHRRTCPCGATFRVDARTIRKHLRLGSHPRCLSCTNRAKAVGGRRGRPVRDRVLKADRELCQRCFGLPHRVLGPVCRCGLRFSPLPPMRIDDVVAAYQAPGRVMPDGGGW